MAANPKPGALIFGRTAAGENLPVAVNPDGTLDISVSPAASSSQAINDGVTTTRKASVLESTATPGTFGLVALASDGSDISGGGGGGGAVTVADGADVAEGATTDAKVTGDNTGTVSAKLRGLNYLWNLVTNTASGWLKVEVATALPAGANSIGQVTANAGTNLNTSALALETGGNLATVKTNTDVLGATTDAKVTGDNSGTESAKLRGLNYLLNAVTDTVNGWLKVSIQNASIAVTGAVTAALSAGTNLIGYIGCKVTYGAKTTLLSGGLTSLANGSAYQTDAIDNTTTRYSGYRIRVQTKGQTSGTGLIDWYVFSALGDTTFTDGASATAGAFTAANRLNSRYIGSTKMNANTTGVTGELQMKDAFKTAPDKWGLIGINNSGAALSATAGDHLIEYEGIY